MLLNQEIQNVFFVCAKRKYKQNGQGYRENWQEIEDFFNEIRRFIIELFEQLKGIVTKLYGT